MDVPQRSRDDCPVCGTRVEPVGSLGLGHVGESESTSEPCEERGECPECHAKLTRPRDSGDAPWTVTA
jgi:hypothetical protein